MRRTIKKSSTRKGAHVAQSKAVAGELTASQRRLLQLLVTGIEGEEPNLLAGRP